MKKALITIIKNKQTEYKIIYPLNATKSEKFAAQELKRFIFNITGVELAVEKETEFNGKVFSIGNTEFLKNSKVRLDDIDLNGDGFVIKCVNQSIIFCAKTNRGIVYSVYHFLEKYCGVRFLDINQEYFLRKDELCFKVVDEINIPSFRYRGNLTDTTYHTPDCRGKKQPYKVPMPIFYAEQRFTHEFIYLNKGKDIGKTDEFYELLDTVGGGVKLDTTMNPTHNNLTYVSPDKYLSNEKLKEKNSHMFFILNDKVKDICYSDGIDKNGAIIQGENTATVYLESLKSQILSNPDAVYFNCGQEDLKEFEGRGAEHGATYMVLRFYNAIAKAIKQWAIKTIPNRRIRLVIFSYLFSKEAPPIIDESVILCDNIVIRFADLFSNTNYPLTSKYAYMPDAYSDLKYGPDYFEKWKPFIKNCAEIWYWGYTTNHTFYYFYQPTIQKIKPLLSTLKKLGVSYCFLQNNTTERNDFKAIIDNYVCSKMLWDISLNPYKLRKEFINLYYDIIADDVLLIIKGFDKVVKKLDKKCGHLYYGKIYSFYPNDRIAEDVVDKGIDDKFVMAKFCERTLSRLDTMQSKVNNSNIDDNEKNKLLTAIDMIRLTPLYILSFYRDYLYGKKMFQTSYFENSEKAFNQCVDKFFGLCEKLEVYDAGEAKKPEWHKNLFKLN